MSRRWLDSILGIPRQTERCSRRDFVRASIAGSAGLLISTSESRAAQQAGRGRKVIIVGAGMAGLAAAHELTHAGCEVIVLEASNRVGGRVHSLADFVPQKVAEAGGEFIGANHPTFLSYMKLFDLDLLDVKDYSAKKGSSVVLNGKKLTDEELKATRSEIEFAINATTLMAEPVIPEQPWMTPRARELDQLSTAEWIQSLDISALSKQLIAAQFTGNNAVSVKYQSHLGNLSQIRGGGLEKYWTDSERFRCRGGNDQVAKKLAARVGVGNVVLDSPVKKIILQEGRVSVTTAADQVHEGDDVILCVPPSVWSRIRIEPELPQELLPQMGQAVKFLNDVRNHFWERHEMGPSSMSHGGIGHSWLGTENQNEADPREVLISFISGPAAKAWSDYPADKRVADYQRNLEDLQPGFLDSVNKTTFIDWLNREWTKGGYSFPAPGQVTSQGPMLQQGIGRLHFAGEHTCYQFIGYMEGALRSGVDAAKRVLRRRKL